MAIKKEWRCLAHGDFESTKPVCPFGCNTVTRVHITPPSISTSGRTQNIDRTLEGLAGQFNMTDISNRNGSVSASRKAPSVPDMRASFVPLDGKTSPVESIMKMGYVPDNALSVLKEANAKGPVPAAGSMGDVRSQHHFKAGH